MVNQIVTHIAKELKSASKKNDAPIWLKLAKSALKSNSNQKTINLKKINENSDEGNAIIIPGKVAAKPTFANEKKIADPEMIKGIIIGEINTLIINCL